jgi:putative membrane protein
MRKTSFVFIVGAAVATAGWAAADVKPVAKTAQKTGAPAANATGSASNDATFMTKAAGDGMAEVELGRLATERAASGDVKSFAQMLVDDHSKANSELKGLAGQKNVSLPSDPPPPAKATYDRLSKLSGDAFDRAYSAEMVKDHEKAVALFSKEAAGGRDADAKSWAAKTLPTLKQHLAKARELAGGTHGAAHKH